MLAHAKLQTIVCTSNPINAESFYRDVLGLVFKNKSDGALVFAVGGSELRVSPVSATSPSENTVVGFAVTQVDTTIAQLAAKGVVFETFEGFPHEPNGALNTPDGSRVAWFRDPDGNLLSVVQFE